jgi:hypothetical protein
MISLNLDDKGDSLDKRTETLARDVYIGAVSGVGAGLVAASGAAFYYARYVLGYDIPECCAFVAISDILTSKPVILTGGSVGALAGSLVYMARRRN